MRRLIGAAVASILGAAVAFSTPVTVSGALLWILTASPLAVATGTPTTFTLTASNLLLGRIECVTVDVPANFNITTVAVVGSTAGDSWLVRRANNRIIAWTSSGGDRLELLDSVTFTVTATALSSASLTWPSKAFDRPECTGAGSLLGVPPIVVVTGPAVTPSPTPSPVPVSPAGSPRPTSVPDASASATLQPDGGSSAPPPSSGSRAAVAGAVDSRIGDARPAAPRVAFDGTALELGLGSLGVLAGATTWIVPVATIGGPGLIVLLWVAARAGGASIWIPAARRLRRGDDPRLRRRTAKSAP